MNSSMTGTQAHDDRPTVIDKTTERKQEQAVPSVPVEATPAQKAESVRMLTMLRDFQVRGTIDIVQSYLGFQSGFSVRLRKAEVHF